MIALLWILAMVAVVVVVGVVGRGQGWGAYRRVAAVVVTLGLSALVSTAFFLWLLARSLAF